jgi:hypothetical protein
MTTINGRPQNLQSTAEDAENAVEVLYPTHEDET